MIFFCLAVERPTVIIMFGPLYRHDNNICAREDTNMPEKKRIIENDAPLKKDDLIVITGAGGFIAGNLAQYFKKKGFTEYPRGGQEAAVRVVSARSGRAESLPGREHRGQLPPRLRRRGGGLQPGGRHGRHGLHRTLPHRMPAQHPHQHPHDRGRLPGRRAPLLFLLARPAPTTRCLQKDPNVRRLEGIRRLSGHGRARLRLGEADFRRCSARNTGPNAA